MSKISLTQEESKVGLAVSDCKTRLVLHPNFKQGSNNRKNPVFKCPQKIKKDTERKRRQTLNNKEQTCTSHPSGNKRLQNQ